jgi:Fur family transcriptional regulator, ferric uptake regulator
MALISQSGGRTKRNCAGFTEIRTNEAACSSIIDATAQFPLNGWNCVADSGNATLHAFFATDCHLAHSSGMSETLTKRPGYERQLRRAGVRITRPRQVILDLLATMEGHPDAMEIYRRAVAVDPTMSLSTVYRTMKLLEGFGAIHRHAFEGGRSRFENAAGEHHDHLIDIETGDVIEFKSDRIERLQNEIARELGYDIVHHRLELYGRRRKEP